MPWVEHQRARSLFGALRCSSSPFLGVCFSWVLWHESAESLALSPRSWFCFLFLFKGGFCKASVWSFFFVPPWVKRPVSLLA